MPRFCGEDVDLSALVPESNASQGRSWSKQTESPATNARTAAHGSTSSMAGTNPITRRTVLFLVPAILIIAEMALYSPALRFLGSWTTRRQTA